MERDDVRVPHAAAPHARGREQPHRSRMRRRDRRADRLRQASRRALGHLRGGLPPVRRASELPVPGLRRAGPRLPAWPGRRPRHRPVCLRARAAVRAARCARQSAAPRSPRPRGALRSLRGGRLHAIATAARRGARRGALLHGASPGHDPRRTRQRAERERHGAPLPRRAHRTDRRAAPLRASRPRPPRSSAPGSRWSALPLRCAGARGSSPGPPRGTLPSRRPMCSRTAGTTRW